jgi:hypothetical protein
MEETTLKALAKTEKWFSDEHDRLYAEHEKLKGKDTLFSAIFESAMGAHDRAWINFQYLLTDLKIPCDVSRKWRE